MKIFDRIFNRDIHKDIKKNILKYQFELYEETNNKIKDVEFNHWLNTKKWLDASFELRLEFNNLYFNYRLNELLTSSDKIMSKDYVALKKIWIEDYANKFWTLNERYHSETGLSPEEFEKFFKLGEII